MQREHHVNSSVHEAKAVRRWNLNNDKKIFVWTILFVLFGWHFLVCICFFAMPLKTNILQLRRLLDLLWKCRPLKPAWQKFLFLFVNENDTNSSTTKGISSIMCSESNYLDFTPMIVLGTEYFFPTFHHVVVEVSQFVNHIPSSDCPLHARFCLIFAAFLSFFTVCHFASCQKQKWCMVRSAMQLKQGSVFSQETSQHLSECVSTENRIDLWLNRETQLNELPFLNIGDWTPYYLSWKWKTFDSQYTLVLNLLKLYNSLAQHRSKEQVFS